jgi:predicted nucleic acid-binding protein
MNTSVRVQHVVLRLRDESGRHPTRTAQRQRIYAAVTAAGREARGARAVDLMIAAVACSVGLPLYTRNPSDFATLDGLVDIVAI